MKTFAALFLGVAALFLGVAALSHPRDTFDPVAYERQQIAIEQARTLAPLQTVAAAAWVVLPLLAVTIALGVLAALGGAAVARSVRYSRPDAAGRLPILRTDQHTARAALLAAHATEHARAGIQPAPVTYAPHVTYSPHSEVDYRADSGRAAVLPDEAPVVLPGLTDLAALGFRPSLDAILLGLGEGGERITVTAKALCHVALVGATGGGKSNLMRLLLAQLQACGAQVVLADPHHAPLDPESGDDWRLIVRRLHLAPAVSASEIGDLLAHLGDELDRRLRLRREGERWGPPLFLALDELPVIADTVPGSVDALGRLLREGRKVGLYTVGAAQSFLVKVIGGDSSAREAYRTAFYVGGDLRSAAVLLDLAQREIAEGALGAGVAYLRSAATSPARLVRVPLASNAALAGFLQADGEGLSDGFGKPDGSLTEATDRQASTASIRPEAARAAALFRAGRDLAEIVEELRGVTSKQGRRYQEAAREVQQLLREAL